MRKYLIALMVSVLLMICTGTALADTYAPGDYTVGDDIPAGWYSLKSDDGLKVSIMFLPEGGHVTVPSETELTSFDTVQPFTAAIGTYTVGVDFPAGTYSVRCAVQDEYGIVNVKKSDEEYVSFSEFINSRKGDFIGKLSLADGDTVKVSSCSMYFYEPNNAIVFD